MCASFLSSAVEPIDYPEELQETTQEEQLLLASFTRTLMLSGRQMLVVTGSTCSPCRRQAVLSVLYEVHDELFSLRLFCEEQLFISLLCLNSDFTC